MPRAARESPRGCAARRPGANRPARVAAGLPDVPRLRAAQEAARVALIITAGILTSLLQRADLSTGQLSLLAMAMSGGALAVSHINDAGYWMFTKLAGLDVRQGCARGRS